MDSAPESAAAAEPRPLPALRSSRVSFNRLFVVRYLLVGDILSINLDGNIYAFNVRLFCYQPSLSIIITH